MDYAIILAGGAGTRFWPLSTYEEPKQFLSIFSDRPLFEETVLRIRKLIVDKNIYIATNKVHSRKIKNCLKKFKIPFKNLFFEPEVRNTLAPIAFLSQKINDMDRDAVIVVSHSDNVIKHNDKFLEALKKGVDIARQGYIVTLGTLPQRPETGYGYIKIKSKILSGRPADKKQKSKIYRVDRFIEKPNLSNAKKFVQDKKYYWNSGIFIFRSDIMLGEVERFMPKAYKIIMRMKNKQDFNRLWQRLPSLSIDYAVMEKTKKAALLPVDYDWIDLGTWQAIGEILKKDRNGNIFKGNCRDVGSKNSLVWSNNRLVVTLGLKDIIIVDTKNALLVCSKDKTQDVKKIAQKLKQKF